MPTYSAQRIVDRALITIGVLEAEESATSEQLQDALDTLNDLLHEWVERGIGTNYIDVSASTEMILDASEYRALRLSLASDLGVSYQVQESPALRADMERAMRVLEAKYENPRTLCTDPELRVTSYNILTDS